MYKCKAVLLDVDGTIFDIEGDYDHDFLKTIDFLKINNVEVALATSRVKFMSDSIIRYLKLNTPCILENGALIFDPVTNEFPLKLSVSSELVKKVLSIIQGFSNIRYGISTINGFYANKSYYSELKEYLSNENIYLIDILDLNAYGDILSVWIRDLSEKMYYDLTSSLENESVRIVTERNLETVSIFIFHKDAKKELGFTNWCSYCNISPKEVLFIGDSDNDIEIAAQAGMSACVNNATKNLKLIVNKVAEESNGRGVAEILKLVFKL